MRLPADHSETKIQLELSDFFPAPNWQPSWNIAPTQPILTVVRDQADGKFGRAARVMRWGLIPSWAKEPKTKFATFNARSEGIEAAPAFRSAWKAGRRCLIVTDGFYEWRKSDKQAFAIGRADGKLTIMAGLSETWKSESETILSCTIITTEPNQAMAPIHNRMPVILAEADWPAWLGESDAPELKSLLRPYAGNDLVMWKIGPAIGKIRNNGPSLLDPQLPDEST